MKLTRRTLLRGALLTAATPPLKVFALDDTPPLNLTGQVGITTGSFMRHLTIDHAPGKLRMLDLPKIMRDDLDMRVIDLMTATLPSFEPRYLDDFRSKAEKANCVITNLKMNQKGLDMTSPDPATRQHAITVYKQTIDAAHRLGCRWVRPIPGPNRPDFTRLAAAYRELIDYAAPKNISLLIENFGWLTSDPNAIPTVIRMVGPGIDASPDTGNWKDETRFDGLTKAFPLAVTCDFKAFMLEPDGSHKRYDLRQCFQTGWDAGYRGPWCLEHFNDTLKGQMAGFATLRDRLNKWMKENA